MHTAELLDEALTLAAQLGYRVRQEWLDGGTAGTCTLRGEKWLFIDLAQPLAEQLARVVSVLRSNLKANEFAHYEALQEFLKRTQPRDCISANGGESALLGL